MRAKIKRKAVSIRRNFRSTRRCRMLVIAPRLCWRILGAVLAFCLLTGLLSYLFFRSKEPSISHITIKVYDHRKECCMDMDMEEYIMGVVAGEMPISYELEALKAQAVAARTYSYHNMLMSPCGRGGADVCTDSGHCQAYCDLEARKAKWGGDFEKNEAKLKQAVYGTAGEIMTYGGEPIEALYHSTSGGMTEDVENVYSETLPYLRGVESPGEEGAPRYERIVSVSVSTFIKNLKDVNGKMNCTAKTLKDSIGEPVRFESGRVDTIKIGGIKFTGKQISKAFSLSTTNFTIEVKGDNVSITTRGYGHGVGMSQVGANAMAGEKSTYRDILLHYYTGIEISTI